MSDGRHHDHARDRQPARFSGSLETFPLQPASREAVIFLTAIAFLCVLLAFFLIWSGGMRAGTFAGSAIALCVAFLFIWFAVAQRNSRVIVSDQELSLRLPMYSRRIPLHKLQREQIRTVNDVSTSPYQLGWRLNGLGAPGYSLGWFSSHGKGRMLASVTRPDAVVIPTSDKYTLLLSVQEPKAFVSRLQAPG